MGRKNENKYLYSIMSHIYEVSWRTLHMHLILSGIRWVEQYNIVNVLANEQYIGRVPEGRTIYWTSLQGRTIYWSERNNNCIAIFNVDNIILQCNILAKQYIVLYPIYCNILSVQYIFAHPCFNARNNPPDS
jgi:hypothetical protein